MNPADRSPSPPTGDAETHPLDWLERTGTSGVLLHELDTRRRRRVRRRRRIATWGGVAALLVSGGVFWHGTDRGAGTPSVPSHATIVAVPERRVLADGSIVELKEGAAIDVDYTDRARRVALRQGEAHFQVRTNDAIPFIVAVAGVEIRAVGTAFAVVAAPAAVEVLVTEGRVAVEDQGPGTRDEGPGTDRVSPDRDESRVVVGAGSRVVVEPSAAAPNRTRRPHVTEISVAELDERLSWRVPRIEFSGMPLAEAIPMFNRHSRVRVSLGDPALGRLRLSGILRADNVDALVRLLEANYGVTAGRTENEIVLRKASAAQRPN